VEAAGRYAIAKAWETPASVDNPAAAPWRAALETAGAAVQAQRAGGWADLGDGVALWVLWPPAQPLGGTDAENENSLVAKLVYGDFQVLLTGDAGPAAERSLVEAGTPLAATVLKVAHHGSDTATSADWLAAVQPALAVIQVGEGNRYGHPSPQTLARLGEATILRTDTDGRIHLWTDGARMWTSTAGN
jgi:competence protein ComEC